ncbi:MAG: arylsulfatase [Bacteroidota bacterium]
MRYFLLSLVLQFTSSLSAYSQAKTDSVPPNVIVIVVDDMGWNDVGYHGSEIQTPTIDRLALEGVELDRFYVHSSCTPTRSSLMTGKTALRLGIVNPIGKNNELGLPLSEKILPQYFQDQGYSTSLIGKWHLGRFKKGYWPYKRGFDHFYGNLTGGIGHWDHVHGGGLDWQRNGETVAEEGYSTHLLTDEAVRLLNAKSDQPLFMVLSYAAPHMPNEAPAETVALYQHLENENRQLHAAMVTEVDQGIQRIITTLEETGLLDHTIIWFTSDNGGKNLVGTPKDVAEPILRVTEMWGEPLPFPFFEFLRDNMVNGASDNSPLRGGKSTVYEGGLRVPSFIYAPKFLTPQKINHRITVNDLLPTLASAANITLTDTTDMDGVSQWHFLKKEADAVARSYISAGKWGEAYYKDDWKLILNKEGEVELYDVQQDPNENTNLAAEHPAVVTNLKAELLAFPRGPSIDDPLWKVFLDTDSFGGEIDREPYAGKEGRVAGPIHPNLYIAGGIVLFIITLFAWLIRTLMMRIFRLIRRVDT